VKQLLQLAGGEGHRGARKRNADYYCCATVRFFEMTPLQN